MFINFWYPTLMSDELTDEPVHRRMLGQDFVLFRDQAGIAHCLSNVCAHRGGSLADGKIKQDCIECPYHGWQFGADGRCRRVPSMGPEAKIPERAKVDSYPVQEKYGVVFAFLGDLPEADRPPLNVVKEWDQEGWASSWVSWEWHANIERAVENSIDPAHNEFVHPTHGFQGEREGYKVPDLEIIHTDWGSAFKITIYSPGLSEGGLKGLKTHEGERHAVSGHHGPNQLWNQLHLTETNWMHMYQFATPIDEFNSKFFLLTMRNCWLEPERDEKFNERNVITSEQDRGILERLQPPMATTAMKRETLVESDKVVVLYRDALKRWERKGWRIDIDAINRNEGKVAYAIPSPARQNSKGWVIDPVPLIDRSSDSEHHADAAE